MDWMDWMDLMDWMDWMDWMDLMDLMDWMDWMDWMDEGWGGGAGRDSSGQRVYLLGAPVSAAQPGRTRPKGVGRQYDRNCSGVSADHV
jgi:hypothetical protein